MNANQSNKPLKVLGVITARGGSQGIPRKNLALVAGRPLIAYTIAAARGSRLARVVMSTDNTEIAAEAQQLGVEVPFLRPAELAKDNTPTLPVLQDVVRRLESSGERFDAVFTLQPTNPLRLASDIDGAIDLMQQTSCDSVIGFSEVGERHPARMKQIDSQGRVIDPPFAEQFEGQRRQDLPKYYLRDGSVYLTRRDVLIKGNSIKGNDCRGWLIPKERSLNIDEPFDLKLVDFLLTLDPSRYPGSAVDS
jgi:CMP-N,N'-diacetyllegionaminic acid synthase